MSRFLAYIDPGTGSVVLQATVGAVAGGFFALRNRIRNFFAKFTKGNKSEESPKN